MSLHYNTEIWLKQISINLKMVLHWKKIKLQGKEMNRTRWIGNTARNSEPSQTTCWNINPYHTCTLLQDFSELYTKCLCEQFCLFCLRFNPAGFKFLMNLTCEYSRRASRPVQAYWSPLYCAFGNWGECSRLELLFLSVYSFAFFQ